MTLPWDDPSRPVLGMKLDGGRPCLDLLNTLVPAVPGPDAAAKNSLDLLLSYEDLLALAVRTAILPAKEADSLHARSAREKGGSLKALAEALEFRALLRRLLGKTGQQTPPSARDLAVFEEKRAAARSLEILVWEDARYLLRPRYLAEGFSAPLHAFVRDTDVLLRSPELRHVRVLRINSPESRFILG